MEPSGLETGSQVCQLCSLRQVTQLLWAWVFTLTKWVGYANSRIFTVSMKCSCVMHRLILVGPGGGRGMCVCV